MKESFNRSNAVSGVLNFISNIFYGTAALLIVCVILCGAFAAYLFKLNAGLPAVAEIKSMSAAGGIAINYSQMPGFLSKAIVCAYDPDFFTHKGLTVDNMKTGLVKLYKGQPIEFGDKTITQNLAAVALAESVVPASGSAHSLASRLRDFLRENLLAYKIESKIKNKDKILEIYFNNASFGEGVAGLLQASVVYCNKKPVDLSEADCLTIASILKLRRRVSNDKDISAVAAERENLIKVITARGLIDKSKADGYKFEDFKLGSYHSKIDKFIRDGFVILKL
jgi:membrane carboxypeptidase/penicillin-binding protein